MGEWADYWHGPEPVAAQWPGTCANCGAGYEQGMCANETCGRRNDEGVWERTAATRAFCDKCEHSIRDVLRDLPGLYARLHVALGGGGASGEKVSGSRELPVPIRLGVEELIDDVEWTVFGWEDVLREALRGPPAAAVIGNRVVARTTRLVTPSDADVRECAWVWGLDGWAATEAVRRGEWRSARTPTQWSRRRGVRFAESCGWLADRVTPLLASDGGETAGLEFLALASRCQAALGTGRLVHRLPAPCPSCDLKALQREDGKDAVRCTSCRREWSPVEYERLVLVLASESTTSKRKPKSA